ncbi:tryptophan 7-halogenase [Catenovulum sediminis]|uniref:Tryptophan 7-halogenase n=1 Tax=Catenovulum sediminis TaxID=1740262 RepID=A0ABV1RBW0_9ALTE|nr:tryptophan 7-halogenase [Catenovulum sediminis]
MKILILGNNLAAWMTAKALSVYSHFEVTIAGKKSSNNLPAIQSALPYFDEYLKLAQIPKNEFTQQVINQPLLAHQVMTNINNASQQHWFAFSEYGAPLGPLEFHQAFARLKHNRWVKDDFCNYSLAVLQAKHGKYQVSSKNPNSAYSTYVNGYIIDTASFIHYLQMSCPKVKQLDAIPPLTAAHDLIINCSIAPSKMPLTANSISWLEPSCQKFTGQYHKTIEMTAHGLLSKLALPDNKNMSQCQLTLNHLPDALSDDQTAINRIVAQYTQQASDIRVSKQLTPAENQAFYRASHIAFDVQWQQLKSWSYSAIDTISVFIVNLFEHFPRRNDNQKLNSIFTEHYTKQIQSLQRYDQLLHAIFSKETNNNSINLFKESGRILQLDPDLIKPDWIIGLLMSFDIIPAKCSPYANQLTEAQLVSHCEKIKSVFNQKVKNI